MQITITVADKVIKSAISNTLDGSIYKYFDSATIKAAKLPKISALTKQIFEDPKFQAELTKQLQRIAETDIEDIIYNEMYDLKLPGLDALVKQCEKVIEEREAELDAEREADEVKRMVKTLERAGFKIVKA
jgi:hypothetical protein